MSTVRTSDGFVTEFDHKKITESSFNAAKRQEVEDRHRYSVAEVRG